MRRDARIEEQGLLRRVVSHLGSSVIVEVSGEGFMSPKSDKSPIINIHSRNIKHQSASIKAILSSIVHWPTQDRHCPSFSFAEATWTFRMECDIY